MCYLSQQNTQSDKDVEKILVGNKCDLDESEHVVPYETVQKVSLVSCDLPGYHDTDSDDRGTEHQLY